MLASRNLTLPEVATLINLMPGTAEEARALVGTLDDDARMPDDELQAVLDTLQAYKSLD